MVDHPMQDDPFHQVLKGMVDELIAIKDYRVRAFLIDDPETSELYTNLAEEEMIHFGELLKQALKLDDRFKLMLLKGMRENTEKETEVEETVEEVDSE